MPLRHQYKSVGRLFARYWSSYGGLADLISSPYLHTAMVLNILMYDVWLSPGWWNLPITVLPNLVGFTLGGYAILVAFGDDKFRALLASKEHNQNNSPFVVMSATFMHFILTQVLSLVTAIAGSNYEITANCDFRDSKCLSTGRGVDILYTS